MTRSLPSALTLVAALAVSLPLSAEDVTTLDGKTYTNLKVTGETPDNVKIIHDGGISTVKKSNLPQAFLELHEMAPSPVSVKDTTEAEHKKLISAFVAASPLLTTKDGRTYKSTEITAVEPSGLKLITDTGLVRVRFIDLPEKVRQAFNYDPLAASEYERAKEDIRIKGADRELRIANAASVVDAYCATVRMYLKQNVGRGWLCDMVEIREVDDVVVTSRPGSPLSGPKVIYEAHKVRREVATAALNHVMVFGLPDYNTIKADHDGRRVWSGKVYLVGGCELPDAGNPNASTAAMHVDRAKAIDLVMNYGAQCLYTPAGEPVPDISGAVVSAGNGTGFAVTNDGHLITSAHVVDDATSVDVYVSGAPMPAKVLAMDTVNDLAILHVPGLQTAALPIIDSEELPLGSPLFVAGYPMAEILGTNVKLTRGDLNALAKDSPDKSSFQMSVPIQGGNSGGPVCTRDGRVTGVVRSTLTSGSVRNLPQNVNYAVRASLIRDLVKPLPGITLSSVPPMPGPGQTPEDVVVKSTYLIVVTTKR